MRRRTVDGAGWMSFCVACGNGLTGRYCAKCGQDSQSAPHVVVAGAPPGAAGSLSSEMSGLATGQTAVGSATGAGQKSSKEPSGGQKSVRRDWRDSPLGGFLVKRSAPVGAVSADATPEEKKAARAERDAAFSIGYSAAIREKKQERATMTARADLAMSFFTRQFKIRGGQGFGLGTGGGRPRKHDKALQPRADALAKAYANEVGDFKNFSPFDWWQQSPTVKKMYADNLWSTDIEPQGHDEGVQVDGEISAAESVGTDTWQQEGTTKYFQNDLIKELLRSCWYEWTPAGKFIRLKTVKEWRVACLSKFGTHGPGRTQAYKWREKEDARVRAWKEGVEQPGAKTAFKGPPNVVEMVKHIDAVRAEAKKMTTLTEPGRPKLLLPSMYEELKQHVKQFHSLLGFSATTVAMAAHNLLHDKLEPDDDEEVWLPSDDCAYWYSFVS